MKRLSFTFVLGLVLVASVIFPVVTGAGGDGPSANGSFQITLVNGLSREVQFNARLASDGSTTGEIVFRDAVPADAKLAATKNTTAVSSAAEPANRDEAASGSGSAAPFYAKAVCDCLSVKGIEAAMSGTITESSLKNYVGRRVVVVVQDGDSLTPPLRDKLTFGFYRIITKNWVATDGERPDEGVAATWVATDAERSDDVGRLSQKGEEVTCESLPISAHSFLGSKQGRGKIEVRR